MRKLRIILPIFIVLFSSCSSDCLNEVFIESQSPNDTTTRLKIRGDNEYDLLGFAFDATGPYLDQMKTAYQVIDVKKLQETTGLIMTDFPVHSELNITSGSDAKNLLAKYIRKFSVEGKVPVGGLPFIGNLTSELNNSNTITSKYSYAYADMNVYICHHNMKNIDISILQQYLTQDFKDDLLSKTPAQIIAKYGTHVYTDVYTGGKLNFKYRAYVHNNTKEESVSYGAKVGVEIATNTSLSVSSSTSYITTASSELQQVFMEYRTIGGTGASIFGNWMPGSTTPTINFNQWSSTISRANPHSLQLIDVGDNSLMAIYEFVDDPMKKASLKTAINNYILGTNFNLVPVVPLYQYKHKQSGNHFYTIDWDELKNGDSYWSYQGIAAFVCANQEPGTVPLYRFYKKIKKFLGKTYHDHYYTRIHSSGINYNYKDEGVECYVYPTMQSFTVGFRQFYNSSIYDHFYNTNPYENPSGWSFNGDCCYVIDGIR
jgi:hypothetical protein